MEKELLLEIKEKIGAIREQLDELEQLVLRAEGVEEPNVNASVMPKFWELPSSNSFNLESVAVENEESTEVEKDVVLSDENDVVLQDEKEDSLNDKEDVVLQDEKDIAIQDDKEQEHCKIESVSSSILSDIQNAISAKAVYEEEPQEKSQEESQEEPQEDSQEKSQETTKEESEEKPQKEELPKEEILKEPQEQPKKTPQKELPKEPKKASKKESKTINDTTESRKSVMESLMSEYTWMSDIPRSKVKNIHSSISLSDRALFTRELFGGNATLYRDNIGTLNDMPSFNAALEMLRGQFPDWDLKSDTVYRFMMAVRSKLDKE